MFRSARQAGLTMALVMLMASGTALAQATQPVGQFDHLPLRRENPAARRAETEPLTNAVGSSARWLDLQRLGISLGIVLVLVIGTGWLYRRVVGGAPAVKSSSAVRLLSRTVLAPRQQVLLLQVGRRVVVVADSAGHLTTLAEVTNPDEVSELVASLPGHRDTDEFSRVFNQQERELDALDRDDQADVDAGRAATTSADAGNIEPIPSEVRSEIGSLIARVRALSGQMKR